MNTKVKTTNRFLAYILDIFLVSIVASMLSNIQFINPYYDDYLNASDNYTEIVNEYAEGNLNDKEVYELIGHEYYDMNKYCIIPNLLIVLCIILYFGVFQKFNNGQTLGKKIMHLKVVDDNNESPSLWKMFGRTILIYFASLSGVIVIVLNALLILVLKENVYFMATSIVSLAFLIFNVVSWIQIIVRKDGRSLQDIIFKTKVVQEA